MKKVTSMIMSGVMTAVLAGTIAIPKVEAMSLNISNGYNSEEYHKTETKTESAKEGEVIDGNVCWKLDADGTLTLSGKGELSSSVPAEFVENTKKIVIDEGITSLGYTEEMDINGKSITYTVGIAYFGKLVNATELYLPSTLERICDDCFRGCTSLKRIYSKSKNLTVGKECFRGCDAMEDFSELFRYVTTILGNPFTYCENFTKLTIPNNVQTIYSFNDSNLKELVIEDNPNLRIERGAFSCYNLEYLYLGRDISFAEGAFPCVLLSYIDYADKESLKLDNYDKSLREYILGSEKYEDWEKYEKYRKHYQRLRTDDYALAVLSKNGDISEEDIELAKNITAGIDNDYDKAKAIVKWVAENMWYDYAKARANKGKPVTVENPEPANGRRKGVCADYSALTKNLLCAVGIPARTVTGLSRSDGHAWNEAYVDGRWILIDTTWLSLNSYKFDGTWSEQQTVNIAAGRFNFDEPLRTFAVSHDIVSISGEYIEFERFSQHNLKIIVDGNEIDVPSVMVFDNNCFRIRDIAYLLKDTPKAFDVSWNSENEAMVLTSGVPYKAVGGELENVVNFDEISRNWKQGGVILKHSMEKSSSVIMKDRRTVHFDIEGYNVYDNNYFKLRDVGRLFDVYIGWDSNTGNVVIDTSRGYDEV